MKDKVKALEIEKRTGGKIEIITELTESHSVRLNKLFWKIQSLRNEACTDCVLR